MSDQDIRIRIKACEFCIEVLKKLTDDPRQPDALRHYEAQLKDLQSQLPKPPDVVIGLKTASLSAEVPKQGA